MACISSGLLDPEVFEGIFRLLSKRSISAK